MGESIENQGNKKSRPIWAARCLFRVIYSAFSWRKAIPAWVK